MRKLKEKYWSVLENVQIGPSRPFGYGRIYDTHKEAHAKHKLIKLDDARVWSATNIEGTQLRGCSSYVSKAREMSFEVDLFDVNYLGQMERPFGLPAIDNLPSACLGFY